MPLLVQHLHVEAVFLSLLGQSLVDQVICELNSRLNSQNHVFLQTSLFAQSFVAHVVHVQSQLVAQVVAHEHPMDTLDKQVLHGAIEDA